MLWEYRGEKITSGCGNQSTGSRQRWSLTRTLGRLGLGSPEMGEKASCPHTGRTGESAGLAGHWAWTAALTLTHLGTLGSSAQAASLWKEGQCLPHRVLRGLREIKHVA